MCFSMVLISSTFHGHCEGVYCGAVAVGGLALILAIILQDYVFEVKPAVVVVRLAAGFLQTTVLLLPLHRWCGSVEMNQSCGV